MPIPVMFGINIGLGAPRDLELIRPIGESTAEEVATTGLARTLAPTLAIPRDLRWGRAYEDYSADPDHVNTKSYRPQRCAPSPLE
jgi:beta-glucosidase